MAMGSNMDFPMPISILLDAISCANSVWFKRPLLITRCSFVFDIDHSALLFGFPLVMLVDLPPADEVDTELLSSQGEVAPVPGESMVVDIGQLLHQHPDLMRSRSASGITGILEHSSSKENLTVKLSFVLREGRSTGRTPGIVSGLLHPQTGGRGWQTESIYPSSGKHHSGDRLAMRNIQSRIFSMLGIPVGLLGPFTQFGSLWQSPALFRITTYADVKRVRG
jgi:hypothetical protein